MKLRIIECPWELPARRFQVQHEVAADYWGTFASFLTEQKAREFLALYARGPRVIEQVSLPAMDDGVLQQNDLGPNALQGGGDALQGQ